MLQTEFRKIFENVQRSTSSHQRYLKILSNLYESVPFEDFCSEFFKYISVLLQQNIGVENQPILKCFQFCASFSRYLIDQEAKKNNDEVDSDASHPFLMRLLQELLKYQDLDYVQVRFHACQFIAMLLLNINEDVTLDNDLCDDIQNAMLERITELKPPIRMQAVAALGRLQDVSNNNCPVIKAYIAALGDPSPMVRKEVVDKIAPCPSTFAKIIERTRDIEHTVRMCAFTKLTLIGPKVFKIIDRQVIALAGINDQHKAVRKLFVNMLVKWLSTYDDDYIKLLNALKLDADEEDFKQTTFIYENILDIFCEINPVKEMFGVLQVDENNLVTSGKLSIEVVMYWHHLLNYLEAKENMQEFYEFITPEPLPLVNCIAGYIKEKTSSKLDDWEYLEFQHVLCKLFQIAKKIDLADEASRNALRTLTIKTMTDIKLDDLILTELINILKKIIPDLGQLSNEIFSVTAEIREPWVEQGPDSYLVHEKDFKTAQIRVKLHIVRDELQEAVSKSEFLTAAAKEQELAVLEEKLKDLQQNFVVNPKVRKVRSDLKTTCRCLDIVIALLQNTEMQTLPPSIVQYRREFVEAHMETTKADADVYYRTLKFFVLCALSDKQFAFDKIKVFCTPIIAYRLIPQYNKATLLLSIDAISDLLRVYGPNILKSDSSVETNSKPTGGRRLYDNTQSDIPDEVNLENITCGAIIDVILQIMDDEVQEVRQGATVALCRLVERGLVVSAKLMSRLLLKLFNPLTEKQDQKIQQMLSFSISYYAQVVKGSANVLENAILPTLCSIGNAPKTSPLADINVYSILPFLAALTRSEHNEFSNTHKHLAYSIFEKILNNSRDKYIYILSMMLQFLDEPAGDQMVLAELNKFVETSLKIVTDKHVIKCLSKYRQKLAGYSVSTCRMTEASLVTRTSSQVNESNPEQMGSILSSRATKGSVNSNRVTANFVHSPARSMSLHANEETLTDGQKNDSMPGDDNFNESAASGSSINLELAVSGPNRRSLRLFNGANSDSLTIKTQGMRNKTASDREKSYMADSDSEDVTPKKRWLKRKRTSISQSATNFVGTTLNQLDNINGDQNISSSSTCGNESDAGCIRRSSRIKKKSPSVNEINHSVIIYVPKQMLGKFQTLDISTESIAEAAAKTPGSSRSARKSKEKTPMNDQLRNSVGSKSIGKSTTTANDLNIRKSSRLAEKSTEETPLSVQSRNSMKTVDTSTSGASRTSTSFALTSTVDTRKKGKKLSKRKLESSFRPTTQNRIQMKAPNNLETRRSVRKWPENGRATLKRFANSETDSECSSPGLKKAVKKKRRTSKK